MGRILIRSYSLDILFSIPGIRNLSVHVGRDKPTQVYCSHKGQRPHGHRPGKTHHPKYWQFGRKKIKKKSNHLTAVSDIIYLTSGNIKGNEKCAVKYHTG